MASSQSPNRINSDAEENQTLLTGEMKRKKSSKRDTCKQVGLLAWAFMATTAVIVLGVLYQRSIDDSDRKGIPVKGKRNLVFMVSDGMGPTSLSMTRSFLTQRDHFDFGHQLDLDKFLVGQSRTRSANSLVTDSAAGATAFSCGFKANNSAISVLPDGSPCGTVLEAAKKAGYMTGLVVTTRITDATPACFSAHVNSRGSEDRIAEQQLGEYPLGRVVDLMLGGGRCHFLPVGTEGSCRLDNRNLVEDAQKKYGWSYVSDRAGFDSLELGEKVKLPLMGLFAETDIPFAIDRDTKVYPTLKEMALTALKALTEATKDSDKGFFLLVEGSRIDHAGHDNDPAAQVREVIEYSETFKAISDFLEDSDTQGIVVGTSDHETGGLAAARQIAASYPDYLWYPTVLMNASHSAQYLNTKYTNYKKTLLPLDENSELSFIKDEIFLKGLGIRDPTDEEVTKLKDAGNVVWALSEIISRRAQIGWSTHGHSAADVNIYANDANVAATLRGNHENTEIGKFLAEYLDVDVDAVTRELQEKGAGLTKRGDGWMGKPMQEALKEEGHNLDGGECYHDYGHPGVMRRDAHFH